MLQALCGGRPTLWREIQDRAEEVGEPVGVRFREVVLLDQDAFEGPELEPSDPLQVSVSVEVVLGTGT